MRTFDNVRAAAWAVVIIAGVVGWVGGGAPAAADNSQDVAASALHVVGGPVQAGSEAVVVDVDAARDLELSAVDPVSDTVLWQRPYSPSALTPGVSVTPAAVGGVVLDLVPQGKPSNPLVELTGINAGNGSVRWHIADPIVATNNPEPCGNNDFCVIGLNADGTSSMLVLAPSTGKAVGLVNGPIQEIGPGLYQTDATKPTLEEVTPAGRRGWTAPVSSFFGPGYDPGYGWIFFPVGNLNVGSIEPVTKGSDYDVGASKTVGITISTGALAWTLPAEYLCGGTLAFLETQVACQYGGAAFRSGHAVQTPGLKGVSLDLVGFTPDTGAVTWRVGVGDVSGLTDEGQVAFLDDTTMAVTRRDGRHVLLNTANGKMSPLTAHTTLWCQTNPSFSTQPIHDVQGSGSRVSTTLSFGCKADGQPTAAVPGTFPDSVGITLDGMDVWVSPKGLQTHRADKPFSVT